jgi:hypothetical protein
MVDITNFINSDNAEKVVQIESVDTYKIKEKITVSTLNDSDSLLISATEFSKDSNYENTISIRLTKSEFHEFIQLAKTFF